MRRAALARSDLVIMREKFVEVVAENQRLLKELDEKGGQLAAAYGRIAELEAEREEDQAGHAAEIKRVEAVHASEIAERDERIKSLEADNAALAGDNKRLAASDACHSSPHSPVLPKIRARRGFLIAQRRAACDCSRALRFWAGAGSASRVIRRRARSRAGPRAQILSRSHPELAGFDHLATIACFCDAAPAAPLHAIQVGGVGKARQPLKARGPLFGAQAPADPPAGARQEAAPPAGAARCGEAGRAFSAISSSYSRLATSADFRNTFRR